MSLEEMKLEQLVQEDGATTTSNDAVAVTYNVNGDEEKVKRLETEKKELVDRLSHAVLFDNELHYQNYIDGPPVPNKEHLYHRACSSDGVTCDSWLDTWIDHVQKNCAAFDVKKLSVESEAAKFAYKPCIIAGSGPSQKKNAHLLRDRNGIGLVSCLHNFGFYEDIGVKPDYYLNLDAGPITIAEMCQGGANQGQAKGEEWYWERTKDHTLVTSVTGHPELLKKWRGKILFYMVIAPNPKYVEAVNKCTDLACYFSVGGNTLGACLYMAKAVLGANPIAMVGADFSFSYAKKFHPFDSPYDQQYSGVVYATDVFGNRVGTWPSYFNFKAWFEYIACGGKGNQPTMMFNCTEGGILGAYPEGNIRQITQMTLKEFLFVYNLHKQFPQTLEPKSEFRFLF